jgi:riboflavin synthase
MFTGLITDIGEVRTREAAGSVIRFRIACHYPLETIVPGASIACGGPCLTVIDRGLLADNRSWFDVEAASETMQLTNLDEWQPGTRINLERSLKLGDEMGGHLVTGHIDGVAQITSRMDEDTAARFIFETSPQFICFIAAKGSVALDGTSLTVNTVSHSGFSVLLIPHSLSVTTWGERRAGDRVNLEVDLMARYAARLAQTPLIG